MWQYREAAWEPPRHRWRWNLLIIAATLVAACVAVSPMLLLRRIRAAYPIEPARQRALEICSRADPTFVRFLASERTACYARFPALVAPATANSR